MRKLAEVLLIMKSKDIDAVVISDPYNIRYLCGFSGGEGYLYISEKRQCMLVDSRYTIWACSECKDTDVITVTDGYYDYFNRYISEDRVNVLALEGKHLTHYEFEKMKDKLNCGKVVSLNDEIAALRMIKDKDEVSLIEKAEAIGDAAFSYILTRLAPGMTEKEAAMEIEMYMRNNGADGLSFETIVASGPNSASPHAVPTDRKLCVGDFVTMDFGCIFKGYCSDMTRTVVIGKADEKQKEIYNIVLEAQLNAIEKLRSGITGACGDSYARDVISEAGYGEYFGHGLGHSVGLYIHEQPRLSKSEPMILKPGMVVTVEPGIYISGLYGVRIEDVVVIEDGGVNNLTHSDKKLIEI